MPHPQLIDKEIQEQKDKRVMINGIEIMVSEAFIAKVSGLLNEGDAIFGDKMNQVNQLTKFIKDDKTFC